MKQLTTSYQKSRGAVLIVSLVLLTAMTVAGVAAIDNSTLQSQMARNSLYAQNLYQKSLSEIEAQFLNLQRSSYLERVAVSGTPVGPDNLPGITMTDNAEIGTHDENDIYGQTVSIYNTGTFDATPPPGQSFGIFSGRSFEVNSIATVNNTNSTSDQTQGVVHIVPKE